MVHYRRNYIQGACYFFTVTLKDRKSHLLVQHIDLLRQAMRYTKASHPYLIIAIVVLPEHLHVIWQLPQGDADYSVRWQIIKNNFTRSLKKRNFTLAKDDRGEYCIWQRRYWEHTIRDECDLSRHIDYIHYNPVKHKLVQEVSDWPYSSFHEYVRRGVLPAHWVAEIKDPLNNFGE